MSSFIDSEELWEGEEIRPSLLRAIRGSKISIPVFSQNYANSKYCLLELSQIWESHLSEGQTILPIFMGVEPQDVGHQTGSFEKPFEEHQTNCEAAIVDGWRNALRKVGKVKGWPLKGDATIKEQSHIVDLVVQRALRELDDTPLDEQKYLVGIDFHVDELLHLLHIGSNDVRFVAICGMGGLGKTTMAKAIYNRIFEKFNRKSFLTDVREKASQINKGLVFLQNQLLQDMGIRRDHDISIVCKGSKLIAERLHEENVLLILDDINDHEQLNALAGGPNWFGQGSRVIITTRDLHCLNVLEGKFGEHIQKYEPPVLSYNNALQLFSLHAFSKNEPPEKYRQLSHAVVQYADGLPLTLEVLGTFLIDKTKEEWKETVEKLNDVNGKMLGKSIKEYDDRVFEKLMISYNQLGDDVKTIFLDVAGYCSEFSDWGFERLIDMWNTCELGARLAIKELIQKHLIKSVKSVGYSYERPMIHDQLQDMGRRIILKDSSHGDRTKCTRLWSQPEIRKILKEDTRTHMVEVIFLYRNVEEFEAGVVLSWEDFQRMPNLRFLKINNIEWPNGDFVHLPSKLRWFRWIGNGDSIIPPNFYHPQIVHMELSGMYHLEWNDPPQHKNKCFQKLVRLELRHCKKISFCPHVFSWFPSLQILRLGSCHGLLELPDTICLIASLKTLIVDLCDSLKKLPTSIGNLRNLVRLEVSCDSIKELPEGVGQLEKLEELDVSGCYNLVKLPTSMGRMRSLLDFNLKNTQIEKLPDDFSKVSSLQILRMGGSYKINKALESLLELPSNLICLNCCDCKKLVNLPNLSQLKSLREVDLTGCKNLEEIHGFEGTESLEDLKLRNCYKLTRLADLSKLKLLRKLDVTNCKNLKEIHGLEGTEYLEELTAEGCHKLRELPNLSKLRNLRKLMVRDCENLDEIHGLEGAESLEEFTATRCHKLRKLSDLAKLKKLRKLDVCDCGNLEEIHGLEGAKSLEELTAKGCHKLRELWDLAKLKKLRKLDVCDCGNLEEIHGFEGAESLEESTATRCHKLRKLSDLAKVKKLRKLDVCDCGNLEEIHGFEGAESLEELTATRCHKLREVLDLSKLKKLQKLDVSHCRYLEKIHGLEGAESLKELDAFGCYKLTETTRKIHGKGKLLDNVDQGQLRSESYVADDELYHRSPILCVVLTNLGCSTVDVHCTALVRLGVKKSTIRFSIRIEDIDFTSRDTIYIHHFNGFPFDSIAALEKLEVEVGKGFKLKFWKLLFENKESGQQLLNQQSSATLVAEFFRWSDADYDEKEREWRKLVAAALANCS